MSENERLNPIFLKAEVIFSQFKGKEKDTDVRINKIYIVDIT